MVIPPFIFQRCQRENGHHPTRKLPMPKNAIILHPNEPMPFGIHKRTSVNRVCRLYPKYMHFLIKEGLVMATKEICDLIQEGYDNEAKELTRKHGAIGKGRYYQWNPIKPKRAPTPDETNFDNAFFELD